MTSCSNRSESSWKWALQCLESLLQCLWRGLEGRSKIKRARPCSFKTSPLLTCFFGELEFSRIPVDCCSKVAQWWWLMKTRVRTTQIDSRIEEKNEKKVRENERNFWEKKFWSEFCELWLGFSVWNVQYILLINNA